MAALAAYHLPPGPPEPAPAWLLGDHDEWLAHKRVQRFLSKELRAGPLCGDASVASLAGRAMPYNTGPRRARRQGHFMESFATNAFAAQVRAGIDGLQLLFEHGDDENLGRMPVGKIISLRDMPDGLYYRAELLGGLPELVVSGLRAGLYGARPVPTDRGRAEPLPSAVGAQPARPARVHGAGGAAARDLAHTVPGVSGHDRGDRGGDRVMRFARRDRTTAADLTRPRPATYLIPYATFAWNGSFSPEASVSVPTILSSVRSSRPVAADAFYREGESPMLVFCRTRP